MVEAIVVEADLTEGYNMAVRSASGGEGSNFRKVGSGALVVGIKGPCITRMDADS